MLTFDATSRETCTARRERTATPLQALVLLNDPQFVEASRVLAESLIKNDPSLSSASSVNRDSNKSLSPTNAIESKIQSAFRRLTSRQPTGKELEILSRLYQEQLYHFETAPGAAAELLAIGEAPRDEKLNTAEHAAMTIVVKAIMSFDECVTKR